MKRGNEEMHWLMHQRAAQLQRKRDQRFLFASGGVSTALFAVLLGMMFYLQGSSGRYMAGVFTAASLLSDSAGGYVLVAVLCFFSGVLVTIFLRRYQAKRSSKDLCEEDQNVNEKETQAKTDSP